MSLTRIHTRFEKHKFSYVDGNKSEQRAPEKKPVNNSEQRAPEKKPVAFRLRYKITIPPWVICATIIALILFAVTDCHVTFSY